MNIALIGPSGVGKGTQATNLVTKFNLIPLVTGELLRKNLEGRTAVGFLAQRAMAQGDCSTVGRVGRRGRMALAPANNLARKRAVPS